MLLILSGFSTVLALILSGFSTVLALILSGFSTVLALITAEDVLDLELAIVAQFSMYLEFI